MEIELNIMRSSIFQQFKKCLSTKEILHDTTFKERPGIC